MKNAITLHASLREYEVLLEKTNPGGLYQLLLLIGLLLTLCSTGFLATMHSLESQNNLPVALPTLLVGYLSLFFARHLLNRFLATAVLLISLLNYLLNSSMLCSLAPALVLTLQLPLSLNLFFINLQFHTLSHCSTLLIGGLMSFTVGKIGYAILVETYPIGSHCIFLTISSVNLLLLPFYGQSLRYYIENDISQADALLRHIAKFNRLEADHVVAVLQRKFFLDKISLKKYPLTLFYTAASLSYQTYMLLASFLLSGVVSGSPTYFSSSLTSFEVFWANAFHFAALTLIYIPLRVMDKRRACISLSLVLVAVNLVLTILSSWVTQYRVIYTIALLALNTFFSTCLLAFLLLFCLEYYPLTIKTFISMALLAANQMGSFLIGVHKKLINQDDIGRELVACSAILLFLHCLYLVRPPQIRYELQEIEQKQQEDY